MQNNNNDKIRIFRAVISGCAVGALISTLMLSAASILFVKFGTLPLNFMPLITSFISAVGAFGAGYFSVAMYKKNGMLLGAVTGILLFAIVFVGGLSKGLDNNIISTLIKFAVFAVMSSIGGIMRVNKRVRVKKY